MPDSVLGAYWFDESLHMNISSIFPSFKLIVVIHLTWLLGGRRCLNFTGGKRDRGKNRQYGKKDREMWSGPSGVTLEFYSNSGYRILKFLPLLQINSHSGFTLFCRWPGRYHVRSTICSVITVLWFLELILWFTPWRTCQLLFLLALPLALSASKCGREAQFSEGLAFYGVGSGRKAKAS